MANIFDYMNWRDLKLKQVEFNEIDNLILSRLSYFPFDGYLQEGEEITLKEAYQRYQEMGTTGRILQQEDIELYPILANSIRFGDMKLCYYVNKIDPIQEKQFSAITIQMEDGTIYVSYRGTDNTIIGWKEDFNMSFSELVPAQTDAVAYLEEVAKKYKNKIRVGGHSKGGNLAVYAAAFCSSKIQKRIINVYNNDGPGFCDKIIQCESYRKIVNKVHTYIPQTSIIGRLLNHKEETTILKSTETGIMQHDLYSWQVLGGKFVRDELTNSSEFIDKTITNWLKEVTPKQREKFIDTLFEILNTTQAETLSDIKNKAFLNAKTMVKTYQNLDPEDKKIMIKTIEEFLRIGKSNIPKPKLKKH
ncbi:MAG: DUF2974 domain-containing protein [Clostridia bacterium]|nr:DUF2974 domain-containing protein [Clostridia bacterium]